MGTIVTSQCTMDLATMLGATQANVAAAGTRARAPTSSPPRSPADLDGADMYSVIAALAAACNANPVIFLKYPGNYSFTGLGIKSELGGLWRHRLDNAGMQGNCFPNALKMLQTDRQI